MRGKKYPVAAKANAVGIAAVTSIAEASRQTGIPEPTIHAWYHAPEFEELRSRNNSVMEDEWRVAVQLAFRRSVELLDRTEDPVKAATTGAIIYDKLALSSGKATSRSESRQWVDELDDHEQQTLARLLDDVASGEATGAEEPAALEEHRPA